MIHIIVIILFCYQNKYRDARCIYQLSMVKSGELAFTEGLSKSEGFIRGAKEGFYGSSKSWKGDFETEIVAAPKTKINVPEPTADLITRTVAGEYADFFTYDAGKYVPIKIGVDASLKGYKTPTPSDLYAVKLYTLYNAVRDASEAIKHPDAILKDISGTLKAMAEYDPLRTGTKGGSPALPGVRDVYLITDMGAKIGEIARSLWNKALQKTKSETKASPDSAEFKSLLERNMDEVYRANAESLISAYGDVALAYGASTEAREKFEASYLANLGVAMKSTVLAGSVAPSTLETVYQDALRDLPDDYSIASPESLVLPLSYDLTASERLESIDRSGRRIINMLSSGDTIYYSLPESTPSETSSSMTDRVYERGQYETSEIGEPYEPTSREEGTSYRYTPEEPETPETPESPFYPEKPTPPVIKARNKKGKSEEIAIKPGTVVWIQGRPKGGAMYRLVLPPYRDEDFYATREVPPGYVDEGWTGEGSVKESLQIIGGKPDYDIKGLDLGIARINITVEGGEPEIEFVSDTDSNTGDRSKTVGMGIGQIPVEEWEDAKAQGIEYKDFIREYDGRLVGERQEVKQTVKSSRLQEIYDLEGEVMPEEKEWYERSETVTRTPIVKKKPVQPSLGENIYFGRRVLPNQYNGLL